MRRLVLKADQFAAEAVVAEQRLAISAVWFRRSPALPDVFTPFQSVVPPLLLLFAPDGLLDWRLTSVTSYQLLLVLRAADPLDWRTREVGAASVAASDRIAFAAGLLASFFIAPSTHNPTRRSTSARFGKRSKVCRRTRSMRWCRTVRAISG